MQQNEARLWTRIEQLKQDLINLRAQQVHKHQQVVAKVNRKLLDMELKIRKTLNDTMEQHVEALKAIEEEMVTVRQLREKQGNILVALESSIQELKEPMEDETGGEDQPALDSEDSEDDQFGSIPW